MPTVALRHAVLVTLLDGPTTGYELAKLFDAAVAHYWHATAPQLYLELARMERDGLVSGTHVTQRDRPNKRVMTITDQGRAELDRFVATTSRPSASKNDVLVKVRAADVVDTEALLADLRLALDLSRRKLDGYLDTEKRMLKGRSHREYVAKARRVGPYLTLRRGILHEQGNVEWLADTIDVVEQRAMTSGRPGGRNGGKVSSRT
jgi:DNA-binding PadR family transcriptional regulator